MKKLLVFIVVLLLAVIGYFYFTKREAAAPASNNQSSSSNREDNMNKAEGFNKSQYSLDNPASLWVVVNKQRPIPTDYIPSKLVTPEVAVDPSDSADEQKIKSDAGEAVETMFTEAKKAGYGLLFASGYRSADLQAVYYNGYVSRDGTAAANKYSAKPGTSEHQTGLAFDIARTDRKCYLETCFADTAEGKWLAENAYKYGFTLRYKKGKEGVTGYQYEPWHFRYVGKELAAKLHETGQTMEEFFKL